ASLKQFVRADARVTESFESRIALALAAERDREERIASPTEAHARMLSWRGIVPIAAAAAVVMVWAASANNRATDGRSVAKADVISTPASVEKLIEELVAN